MQKSSTVTFVVCVLNPTNVVPFGTAIRHGSSYAMTQNFMNIDVAELNGAAIVRPLGTRVDLQVAGEFRTALLQLIDVGHHRLVVDLVNVEFMDSSGLGALVAALKTLRLLKGGGDIRLANVRPSVVALLEIIRLHRVFFSYPTVDQAVQSFT